VQIRFFTKKGGRMKIALLGNAKSIHIIRWANGLSKRGIDVSLISLDDCPSTKTYDGAKPSVKTGIMKNNEYSYAT
jgi:hypothetical protein